MNIIHSNSTSKVKQGGDERTTKTVQSVRPGVREEANAVSPKKWGWSKRTLLIFALALRLVRRRIAPSPCPGGGAARASLCRQGTGWLQSWREGVWRARRGTAIAEQAPQQRKTA